MSARGPTGASPRAPAEAIVPTLAILDWGIGGLGFYKALRARRPDLPVIYLSDAGTTPYGKLPPAALAARVGEVAARLRELGARRLVIACNAASTALPPLGIRGLAGPLQTRSGVVEVTGIIGHALRLGRALGRRGGTIGVIGGQRTIRSGIYRRGLGDGTGRRARGGAVIIQRVAQPLSALVEAGELDSPRLRRELARILAPLRQADTLLLACTHYAALAPQLSALLPAARIVDPVGALVAWTATHWLPPPLAPLASRGTDGRHPADRFLTTGNPRAMRAAALRAFAVDLAGADLRRVSWPNR